MSFQLSFCSLTISNHDVATEGGSAVTRNVIDSASDLDVESTGNMDAGNRKATAGLSELQRAKGSSNFS